jgi:outer membrane immunogenic protein
MTRKTKKTLLASVVMALGSIGTTLAADIPVKAPVAAPPFVYNWSGIYVGGHAGYGIGMSDWHDSSFNYETKGFLAGGQIGINQQSGNFVLGIEADASWARIKGDQAIAFGGAVAGFALTTTGGTEIDGLVSVAGRFGFAQDHWLVYLKLGAAWARLSHTFSFEQTFGAIVQTATASGDTTRAGHLIGFGAEYAIGGNWSAKAEYNFVNFGEYTTGITGTQTLAGVTTPFSDNIRFEQQLHLVKVGLNYRFGTPSILAQEPPARPSAGFNWTGAYVGAVAGYGIGWKDWADLLGDDSRFDVNGALAGGTAGVNVHVGRFVLGVEGEWMWSGIKGDKSETEVTGIVTSAISASTRINWLATAAMRAGVVTTDRWLNYVKAGFAVADETHTLRFTQTAPGLGSTDLDLRGSRLHTGLLLGVGTEYAFFANWSVKAEYNYIHFVDQSAQLTGTQFVNIPPLQIGSIFNAQRVSIGQELHLFKVGLNYHFNGPDVVRARY